MHDVPGGGHASGIAETRSGKDPLVELFGLGRHGEFVPLQDVGKGALTSAAVIPTGGRLHAQVFGGSGTAFLFHYWTLLEQHKPLCSECSFSLVLLQIMATTKVLVQRYLRTRTPLMRIPYKGQTKDLIHIGHPLAPVGSLDLLILLN